MICYDDALLLTYHNEHRFYFFNNQKIPGIVVCYTVLATLELCGFSILFKRCALPMSSFKENHCTNFQSSKDNTVFVFSPSLYSIVISCPTSHLTTSI